MNEKYYLVNNYLPCICNCHKACLRKDLINRGIYVISMKEITEKEFYNHLEKLQKKYKNVSLNYKFL
ncbi:MAG: hypothetical protein IJ018_01050 [Bacilli bacterium]|nr:hypothetical protein [Bacilli bacterium]